MSDCIRENHLSGMKNGQTVFTNYLRLSHHTVTITETICFISIMKEKIVSNIKDRILATNALITIRLCRSY